MGRLDGKRIIVTGGAGGLGEAYVRALHQEGASIAVADLDQVKCEALAADLVERIHIARCDVSDEQSVAAAFPVMIDALGGVDCLINNAGTYPHQHYEDITYADWRRVVHTNLDSVFLCTDQVVKPMREQKSGKIINVVTNLIWIMAPLMAHYIASKAGVLGFTRGAARELGAHGITINAIAPGANFPADPLDPAGMARMQEIISYQVLKRPQFAFDLTGAIVFLASDDSDFMSGQVLCVDGGVAAH